MELLAPLIAAGALTLSGIATATDTTNQNDWNPTGLENAFKVSFQGAGSVVVTGLQGGVSGRLLQVSNDTTNQVLCLKHQAAGSAANNRFDFEQNGRGGHLFLMPGEGVVLRHNGSRWQILVLTSTPFGRVLAQRPGSGTTPQSMGILHSSAGGTISHPAIATTSFRLTQRRVHGDTGATAGTQSGTRGSADYCWRGNGAGLGGFYLRISFFGNTVPAGAAAFVGLFGSSAPGNVDPSTLLNAVGFQFNPAETTWRIGTNDGAGTATRTDLGADYGVATGLLEGRLFALPNASSIQYAIHRLDDLTLIPMVGSLTTDLPVNTTLLTPHVWICNRAVAASALIAWTEIELKLP